MQNLFRRPSGIYVLRIVVPALLRHVYKKREVAASTGTRELALQRLLPVARLNKGGKNSLKRPDCYRARTKSKCNTTRF